MADISLKDALSGSEATKWMFAIKEEFKALIKNETWEIVDRPPGKNIIGCKFVLRNKMKDNTLERKKARLVGRGFAQRYGIEFTETYAPVVRMSSIRIITALSASLGLEMHQLDVSTAYLNGSIEDQVYMELPELSKEVLEQILSESKTHEENPLRTKAQEMLVKC